MSEQQELLRDFKHQSDVLKCTLLDVLRCEQALELTGRYWNEDDQNQL